MSESYAQESSRGNSNADDVEPEPASHKLEDHVETSEPSADSASDCCVNHADGVETSESSADSPSDCRVNHTDAVETTEPSADSTSDCHLNHTDSADSTSFCRVNHTDAVETSEPSADSTSDCRVNHTDATETSEPSADSTSDCRVNHTDAVETSEPSADSTSGCRLNHTEEAAGSEGEIRINVGQSQDDSVAQSPAGAIGEDEVATSRSSGPRLGSLGSDGRTDGDVVNTALRGAPCKDRASSDELASTLHAVFFPESHTVLDQHASRSGCASLANCVVRCRCCGHRGHCGIREANQLSLEWACHSAFSVLIACILLVALPPSIAFGIIAPVPFLLLLSAISTTGPNLGSAIRNLLLVPWSLVLGTAVITVVTLPLYCSPIAQTVMYFPVLWLVRYWLCFVDPTASKFVSAVYVITVLRSVLEAKQAQINGETCDYVSWTGRLFTVSTFAFSVVVAFAASFLPFPRCNFSDAAQLNRRVVRDACRIVKHSVSMLLVHHHNQSPARKKVYTRRGQSTTLNGGVPAVITDSGRGAQSSQPSSPADPSTGTKLHAVLDEISEEQKDYAEVCHVQMIEELLEHVDDDLVALGEVLGASTYECGGCCCPAPRNSVLSPSQSRRVRKIAWNAYSVLRSISDDYSAVDSHEGRQFQNFAISSGHIFEKMQTRHRRKQLEDIFLNESGDIVGGLRDDQEVERRRSGRVAASTDRTSKNQTSRERSTVSPQAVGRKGNALHTDVDLDAELVEAMEPAMLRLIKLLDSREVRARLDNGFFLSRAQSDAACSIASEMTASVTARRAELFLSRDGAFDFDVLKYLSVGKLLFGVVNLVNVICCDDDVVIGTVPRSPNAQHSEFRQRSFSDAAALAQQGKAKDPQHIARQFGQTLKQLFFGSLPNKGKTLDLGKLKKSFANSVAIYLASLFFLVPELLEYSPPDFVEPGIALAANATTADETPSAYFDRDKYNVLLDNALWAPLTIVFIATSTVGGSFSTAILRFFGTVTGALAGSLISVVLGDSPGGKTAALTAWVFLSSLFLRNEKYGYAARVAAFTSSIIVFGDSGTEVDSDFQASTYALSRMMQTFLGITVYLLATTFLFPVSARDQGVTVLGQIFHKLQEHHKSAFDLFDRCFLDTNPPESANVAQDTEDGTLSSSSANARLVAKSLKPLDVEEFARRERERMAILKLLSTHKRLARQAEEEVVCCRPAFHPEYLVALRFHLRRVADVHHLMDRALQYAAVQNQQLKKMRMGDEASGKSGTVDRSVAEQDAQLQQFLKGLHGMLQDLSAEVVKLLEHGVNARKSSHRLLDAFDDPGRLHQLSLSSQRTKAAALANERALAFTKKFIVNLMHQASTPVSGDEQARMVDGDQNAEALGPTLISSDRILAVQCFSIAVYKYVDALRRVQDCADKTQMHLHRKPRFAKQIYTAYGQGPPRATPTDDKNK